MLPPTFGNAGAFWIPACAGVRLLGMTVWPVQTDNPKAMLDPARPLDTVHGSDYADRSRPRASSGARTGTSASEGNSRWLRTI